MTQYKYAMWLLDEALVTQVKAEAEKRQMSLTDLAALAFQQLLNPAPPALHWSPAATGNCPRCSKVRAREMAQRRAKGILPHAQRRPSPLSQIVKGTTPVEIE